MAHEHNYRPGDWLVICDVCGFKLKASSSRKRWDGLVVCQADWEARHPMDFIKTPTDKISVPFTRPRPTDIFVMGDFLVTEDSDMPNGDTVFILTENSLPLTTE